MTEVAVLGGGVAAMAAALELSEPELEGRYSVTVYLPGWRLGGKCASGRDMRNHARIQEHGLHVWFGFYDNAFDMIERCYREWQRPPGSPLRTWQQAFKKCNDIVLFERWRGQWTPWHIYVPPDDEVPGSRREVTAWDFLHRLLGWLAQEWSAVRGRSGESIPRRDRSGLIARAMHLVAECARPLVELEGIAEDQLVWHAFKLLDDRLLDPNRHRDVTKDLAAVCELLTKFKCWLFEVVEPLIDDERMRRYAMMVDFWATVLAGIVEDGVIEDGFGKLNREDLLAWLRRHGAERLTLEHGAFISALYDLVFAYREGDKRRPDLAAGKALQAMIRIVTEYKGAALWKMQAGMGDTVFTPLYDVLRRRGVRFRFFHQVTDLGVSPDGSSVSQIVVQPQVRLGRNSYDPIVTAKGLRCWPSEPKWQLLQDGEELRKRGVNFEYDCNPLGLDPVTLERGSDFDEVVLAIPVGALPPICEELATANRRFAEMLEHSDTVMTEGIQLWLEQTATELGWPFEQAIGTSYVDCADTFSDMAQLLAREKWPAGAAPSEVVYLCGVIAHDGVATQADADARVRENALKFLREDANRIWPDFDWQTLTAPDGDDGEQRLDAQFLRANFQPTERYAMTRAGSVEYRLRADESGFDNLKLAGDWTRNGIDGGSVEAAVVSGRQAARAISGSPADIPGETGWLVDD